MSVLDISEVARRSGVPASTLRYYEERGLIASIGRRGLRRLFGPAILDRLALISLGRAAGFSLDEIAAMFTAEHAPQFDRTALSAKADEIDRTIARLAAMRDGLRHAAACRAPSHMECPTFRRILKAAASGAFEPPTPALRRGGRSAR
jgi:DNA-binding transcriptional MerR regulator